MKDIQIHRFNDKIALSVGNGKTVYLTVEEASDIGSALVNCAADTKVKQFQHSAFGTFNIEVRGFSHD